MTILPCPFCGGSADFIFDGFVCECEAGWIACDKCGAQSGCILADEPGKHTRSMAKIRSYATRRWNRRAEIATPARCGPSMHIAELRESERISRELYEAACRDIGELQVEVERLKNMICRNPATRCGLSMHVDGTTGHDMRGQIIIGTDLPPSDGKLYQPGPAKTKDANGNS